MKMEVQIYSKGFRYFRFEKWTVTNRTVTNILYGIKILRFKFFICMV